ncbi:FAD-dependent monooxygenase [Flavisphingomonas formosensis]|uniref:FAD-dependent monooxygenase n=1 Tax=Flavisphingomonas formosensis TaxID=861534 RepID=UPI0012F8F4B8|nr:FAD-dependent monooxygenase [Sphingomonas formosensis]
MNDKPRIAIIGAGLGGVTAAILLQQAGNDIAVYEQAPGLARIGAGIGLGPNVLRVFNHIDCVDQLMNIGIVQESNLNRVWDTGEVLWDIRKQNWEEVFGLPSLTMHRGDLLSVLARSLRPGTIKFDKQLLDIGHRLGGTQLLFTDQHEVEADIVIGADGINSKVREILLGYDPPIYTGFVAFRSIYPANRLGDWRPISDGAKWWSDDRHPAQEDRHFIHYYLTKQRDEMYFVTGSPSPDWPGGVSSVPATKEEIKTCYEGFHPDVQRIIDAAPALSKWPLLERNPLPLWSRDNVVVLGDACHPMKPHMGQGAAMAIEDAAVLFRCIQSADGNFDSAFKMYRATRIERTTEIQRQSHENKWMKHPGDPTWVFGYDAMTVPLISETAQAAV